MATAKSTAKKPAAKKTASKKASAHATKAASKKPEHTQSLRLTKESQSFISSRITLQTVYWSILAIFILVIGVYILNVQLDILNTLEQIQQDAIL